ncbi:MAG: PAS domain S-box protein [Pirellulales bacterium]|nr:PAS domain S-box protein [Pirellulales bacterium]
MTDPAGVLGGHEMLGFAALAEHCDDFLCLANTQGRPIYLNPAARRMIGMASDREIVAAALHEFYTDISWKELRNVAIVAVNTVGQWEGHSQLRNATNGEILDVETRMFRINHPQSAKPLGLAVIHRAAAGDPRLAETLSESEARKQAILESSLDPIITINHEGVITEFNRAAESTFGHARDRVLGTRPSEILFPPSKSEGFQNRIDRYLEAHEGSMLGQRVEVTAVRADGATFPAEMAMTIGQQRGLPVMTFFVRDISLRKKAEEEQARYAAELERSNRELEQFAYVASHDLQEPLRKIRTFADRLQTRSQEALDDSSRECLDRIQDAAERMQRLINALLTLSRVTTKGHEFVRVDLAQIAAEVVSDLEVQIEASDALVEIGKLPSIQADPVQMRQLFQNLIGNALKFRRPEEPPVIRVHGRFITPREQRSQGSAADEKCRIVVEDNGIGFEDEYAERIFGVFQRLHPRDVYEGTGIGLAICRKIVERHGGTISAQSKPGEGSSFVVVLPAVHRKQEKHERWQDASVCSPS